MTLKPIEEKNVCFLTVYVYRPNSSTQKETVQDESQKNPTYKFIVLKNTYISIDRTKTQRSSVFHDRSGFPIRDMCIFAMNNGQEYCLLKF